ncbi:cysteine-rich receptor-like protein kinase 25 [Rutidosis leptorrhynchoides]|uniref:cysteine-rich receptor-like protein kinase 25 n=1 Tax=Rutidosis leptorrhynchoides TaxID=125765 RepID=UPI003A99ECB4
MNFPLSSLFLSILICNIHIITCQTDFWDYQCGFTGDYTPDSDYKLALDSVLSSSFLLTNNGFGFYNSSFGQVKAAAFCRGDIEPESCWRCVDDATREIRKVCPNQMEAVGWYPKCFIRYSNRIMPNRGIYYYNLEDIVDAGYDRWNQTVVMFLETLRMEAARGGQLRKYASANVTESILITIYGFMQCTPDFSETDCDQCLVYGTSLVREYPKSLGVSFYTPNCIIDYQIEPFFNSTWFPPARVQSPGTTPFLALSPSSDTDVFSAVPSGSIVPEIQVGSGDNSPEVSKYDREDDDTGEMNSFNLRTILAATNNFSIDNKLGEGGFGPVYKDGNEIAVKRLSGNSWQGLAEFKTEVQLIIKLQHKNLVRLLGYCEKGSERLLIYEYVVNSSLDTFLFDSLAVGPLNSLREVASSNVGVASEGLRNNYGLFLIGRSKELDWRKRTNIVTGIAKGLRYLHEDSRLKIIHRDMKAGNILLDDEMNSRISDFGTARIFEGKQMEAATMRIVGTHGYMAPEYAMEGLFLTASDVYSFGVLLLEIISGQRNNKFIYNEQPQTSSQQWINIALLCVQEDPQDRPPMSAVVVMLEGLWSAKLPTPSEPPTSFARSTASEQTNSTTTGSASEHVSINLTRWFDH